MTVPVSGRLGVVPASRVAMDIPFGLWVLLPANFLGTSSQAHLLVMSLIEVGGSFLAGVGRITG